MTDLTLPPPNWVSLFVYFLLNHVGKQSCLNFTEILRFRFRFRIFTYKTCGQKSNVFRYRSFTVSKLIPWRITVAGLGECNGDSLRFSFQKETGFLTVLVPDEKGDVLCVSPASSKWIAMVLWLGKSWFPIPSEAQIGVWRRHICRWLANLFI